MLPSLYTGVSGLQNHQTRMNVVANNISNVNTYGFKYSRVAFEDMLSMNVSGAAGPRERRGGVNPKQFGLGMNVASIDKVFTQGTQQNTNRKTDVMIHGQGFFVLSRGQEDYYSRAGNFQIDAAGYLVNPHGFHVQGWQSEILADGTVRVNATGPTENLWIPPVDTKVAARETQNIRFASNLNGITAPLRIPAGLAGDAQREWLETNGHVSTIDIYDSQGGVHTLELVFYRDAADVDNGDLNRWRVQSYLIDPNTGEAYADAPNMAVGADATTGDNSITLDFDTAGALVNVTDAAGNVLFEPVENFAGEEISLNLRALIPGNDAAGGPAVVRPQDITLHLGLSGIMGSGVTQAKEMTPDATSTTKAIEQDGWTYGYVTDFQINDSGEIVVSFDNGDSRVYGQLSMAVFANQEGLEKSGENNYVATMNSGTALIGPADTGSRGMFKAGALEMSNVDLSEQFVDMIVTQRGFQANSRSITTSDQMIQELLTLKR